MKGTPSRLTLFICLGLLLFLAGCRDRTPRLTPLEPGALILAFGDSLTAGNGAGRGASYPAVLEQLTGYRTINAGHPGELSGEGLQRLPDLLQRYRPDLVILCHGGNDLLRRHDPALTAANLRSMIEAVRNTEAEIILIGVPKPGLWLRAAPFYQEIADEYRIPCNIEILPDILASRELKSDTIHPNAAGYRQLAETLAELIDQASHN
ncbi:arylesterase [Syntrophotalea acetylenivorans]|uniref:Arylesterase n=1 Tax=Syntrophotalea acetylenivorans TaxID=1842532 RepID=A0A1L3GR07_9BACT|nr:arylesterase [Syntrophotalea acetylenivorans]APG28379.1 arylesterase [Syntrophotalea acetylenivorans]